MSRLQGGGPQRHVEYDLPASCSSSSVGLQPLGGLRGSLPHSQSWTVVPEYNISLRQQKEVDPYECWKYDVQSQIANMADKLQDSLEQYPDPSTRYLKARLTSPELAQDFDRRKAEQLKQQSGPVANSMAYGLGRK